jgi:hypothetical protein
MSELKDFIDTLFVGMRERIEQEYKHQLKNHFANMTDNLDATKFTKGYGELKLTTPDIHLKSLKDHSKYLSMLHQLHMSQRSVEHEALAREALERSWLMGPDTRIKLPQPLEGRWWIHMAYSNINNERKRCTINFYDNFGQPFIRNISHNLIDPTAPYNFQSHTQLLDKKYQYPLPDRFIDFVKQQQSIEGLNIIGDLFHQIIYIYAI